MVGTEHCSVPMIAPIKFVPTGFQIRVMSPINCDCPKLRHSRKRSAPGIDSGQAGMTVLWELIAN